MVCVYSKQMCSDLIKLGITPRKSTKENPPNFTGEIERHMWRGIFDGDGTLSKSTSGAWVVGMCGSLKTVKKFTRFIKSRLGIPAPKLQKTGKIYNIAYGSKAKCLAILDLLYKNSTVYLQRKYKRYLKLEKEMATINPSSIMDITKREKIYTKTTRAKIASDYKKGNLRVKSIAKRYNTNNTTIRRIAVEFGVSRNQKQSSQLWRDNQKRTINRNQKLIKRFYLNQKLSCPEIAKRISCGHVPITNFLKKQGLLRSRSESQQIRRIKEQA